MVRSLMVLLFCILCSGYVSAQFQSVRIQVLDRGQADGIVIRTPNQEWIVIDAGTNGDQADYMESMGVEQVALTVVSHRHFDHLGGMDSVLARFAVEQFLGITEDCPGNVSDDYVRDELDGVGILALVDTPSTINIDGIDFTVLPLETTRECPDEENLNSIVIRMDYGDFSMLFTGDAEEEALDWLAANYSEWLDVDVLKASHHGSNNGYTDEFLEVASPDRVIISAGVNATYRHPMAQAVKDYEDATGGRVYCTNRHSTISIYGYPDGRIRVNTLKEADQSCVYDGTQY
jgi:competence protein ComEC